ncbi:alpha/beta hydrolase [Solitalea lacus]|uniref:alpha/beta hydrolase n=1 Tax=Solitalea lacus TaxID=2911172 RepID=UPI001EDB2390|nr:alpha/beta hydrolase [Solitalea lacus]UKJ07602.1 alpha/beta hydrolase [Solitalea lacus]
MKTSLPLPIIAFLLSVLSACSSISRNETYTEMPLQILKNLKYGTDPSQTFDLLMPVERTEKTKVIIFLHGGSWKKGDKSDYTPALRLFAQRGFVIVNMNYRLADKDKNKFPAQMDDITSAIHMLEKMANEWGIPMNSIGLAGHSAGAHLALLYSYNFNTTGKIKAVAALAPVSDLVAAGRSANKTYISPIVNFLGKKFTQDSTLWATASPYWMATSTSVPTILFHGTIDKIVPFSQSEKLDERLESLKVPAKLIKYNAGHVWMGNDLANTRENFIKWMDMYLH